ncbi:hypothetical protein K474DRAFT_1667819 [Panus rudis PR-1116 ss-1]|nr:hypothetical protein K474DRAFT_1669860 [Panus rudis PR-1116 ss-1]KAI0072440.1 hypothetical protein K474DRAFT_1667819 [Panus rudis PR-1116 ss-1]
MRKISYGVALIAVLFTLILNLFSTLRADWLVVQDPDIPATIHYGLMQRCERRILSIPDSPLKYTDYKCRPFPARILDACDKENKGFCVSWVTAGYFTELSIGFAVVASLAIVFGVSTHSRRRRIWRVVAAFVAIHAALQLTTFSIVTNLYRRSRFPAFEHAHPGTAYILNTLSWVLAVLVTVGVTITGISANRGHRWAAGNRAYQPIEG